MYYVYTNQTERPIDRLYAATAEYYARFNARPPMALTSAEDADAISTQYLGPVMPEVKSVPFVATGTVLLFVPDYQGAQQP